MTIKIKHRKYYRIHYGLDFEKEPATYTHLQAYIQICLSNLMAGKYLVEHLAFWLYYYNH